MCIAVTLAQLATTLAAHFTNKVAKFGPRGSLGAAALSAVFAALVAAPMIGNLDGFRREALPPFCNEEMDKSL